MHQRQAEKWEGFCYIASTHHGPFCTLDMCILVQIHTAKCFSGVSHKAHNCKTFPTAPKEPAVTAVERQMTVAINAWLTKFQATVYPGKKVPLLRAVPLTSKSKRTSEMRSVPWNLRCKCALHQCRGDWGHICLLSPSYFPISTSLHLCFPGTWVPRGCGKVASGFGRLPIPYFYGFREPLAGSLR